jgi:hypothetical protein
MKHTKHTKPTKPTKPTKNKQQSIINKYKDE